MMPLRPGSVFAGAYEIVRPISAGGMGIVYEVIHVPTQRRRALKVMLANIVSDPEMRARFSLEAVVSAGIDSEHITEIFDAGIDQESDCPYLVMELLRGEDLAARLKRGERFTAEETLLLLQQVARALDRTHAKGVVHRDLKPDNLFVTRRDDGSIRMKILDFGIAKVVKKDFTGPQATTKTFGTPYYMAREQITGESALIGPASDLYAIAQIAFTLLVGTAYFQEEAKESGGNILTVLLAVGRGTTEPATKRSIRHGVELPAAFDPWFAKATALLPKDRFDGATTMIDALASALVAPVRVLPAEERALVSESAARASSERIEESFTSVERNAVAVRQSAGSDLGAETAAPQSITSALAQPTRGRRTSLAFLVATLVLGGAISVVAIQRSRGAARADAASSTAVAASVATAPSSASASSIDPSALAAPVAVEVSAAPVGSPSTGAVVAASPGGVSKAGPRPGSPVAKTPKEPGPNAAPTPPAPQEPAATKPTRSSKGPFESTL